MLAGRQLTNNEMRAVIDGWAGADVMACLGFGRMSSVIQQINTFLREFEREPGHEQSQKKKKKGSFFMLAG